MNSSKVIGLLIAAGASRRLGKPKQLVNYQGQALIQYIVGEMKASKLEDVLVVLGSNAENIGALIPDIDTIVNSNWQEGMGTSVRCGIEQLRPRNQAIMICIVDQYNLTSKVIDEMLLNN